MMFRIRKIEVTAKLMAVLLALLLVVPGYASDEVPPSNGITGPEVEVFRAGMWWDPSLSGSGWDINRVEDIVFGIWYTYDENKFPVWYTTQGPLDGTTFTGELLEFTWDYDNARVFPPSVVGNVTIEFDSPQIATLDWTLNGQSGSNPLQPFIFSAQPALDDHSGTWFDPRESGYGLSVQNQGNINFAVLFYYDRNGNPVWATGQNESGQNVSGQTTLPLVRSFGACPSCDYFRPNYSGIGDLWLEYQTETRMDVWMEVQNTNPFWTKSEAHHVMLSHPPSGRPHPAALARVNSNDAIKAYFRSGYQNSNYGWRDDYFCWIFGPIVSPAPPAPTFDQPVALSSTNVQESGVEETDVIKVNSRALFSLDHHIGQLPFSEDSLSRSQTITRTAIGDFGKTLLTQAQYKADLELRPGLRLHSVDQGLYHYQSGSTGDWLTYLNSDVQGDCLEETIQSTRIHGFEVGLTADLEQDYQIRIEGEMIASRRIDNKLFVATRFAPDLFSKNRELNGPDAFLNYGDTDQILDLIDSLPAEDFLPKVTLPGGQTMPLVDYHNVQLPPLAMDQSSPVLTTLSMFDLDNMDQPPETLAIMGFVDSMYATPQSIYFTSPQRHVRFEQGGGMVETNWEDTNVHKIAVKEGALAYGGSATVEGLLGGSDVERPYRMSEHDGNLRILTSQRWGNRWRDLGEHRLTILGESKEANRLLAPLSVLPNENQRTPIGKPGEDIFGVRYLGDRAYIVTFQQIDPLYAIDLSNPAKPAVLGELEVQGFSEYLHPVGKDLLLGVGMDSTIVNEGAQNQRTVILGMQVGLFDVSDPKNLALLDVEKIGYRGTYSSVLANPKAFTFLPPDELRNLPARFSIPAVVHGPGAEEPSSDPEWYYDWESTSVFMFNVNTDGPDNAELELAGRSDIGRMDQSDDDYFFGSVSSDSQRSVIYNDRVLHYFKGGIWSTAWEGGAIEPAAGCLLCQPDDG